MLVPQQYVLVVILAERDDDDEIALPETDAEELAGISRTRVPYISVPEGRRVIVRVVGPSQDAVRVCEARAPVYAVAVTG